MVPLGAYVLMCCKPCVTYSEMFDLTCAQIVLGSIVTRCPSMSIAPSALQQLDSACELFSVAASGFRADKVLVICTCCILSIGS